MDLNSWRDPKAEAQGGVKRAKVSVSSYPMRYDLAYKLEILAHSSTEHAYRAILYP